MTGNSLLGTIDSENGIGVVRMSDVYPTDPADLWSALTDPARLARWIAEVEGDLSLGGTFTARFTSGWEGSGRIDVCEQSQRLQLTLNPGADDQTTVEAVLEPEHGRTRLVIEERGFTRSQLAGHGAGWQAHIEDLAAYLDGRAPADWRQRWMALTPEYQRLSDQRQPSSA